MALSRGNQIQPLETKNEAEAEEKPGEENIENMLEDAPIGKEEGNNQENGENEKESTEKSGTPIPNSDLKNNIPDKKENKVQSDDDLDELLKETELLGKNKNSGIASNTKNLSSNLKENNKNQVPQGSSDRKNEKSDEKAKKNEVEIEDDDDDDEEEEEEKEEEDEDQDDKKDDDDEEEENNEDEDDND